MTLPPDVMHAMDVAKNQSNVSHNLATSAHQKEAAVLLQFKTFCELTETTLKHNSSGSLVFVARWHLRQMAQTPKTTRPMVL